MKKSGEKLKNLKRENEEKWREIEELEEREIEGLLSVMRNGVLSVLEIVYKNVVFNIHVPKSKFGNLFFFFSFFSFPSNSHFF